MCVKITRMAEVAFERNPSCYSPTTCVILCLETENIVTIVVRKLQRCIFAFFRIQTRQTSCLHRVYWQLLSSQPEHVLYTSNDSRRIFDDILILNRKMLLHLHIVYYSNEIVISVHTITKLRRGGSKFVNSPGQWSSSLLPSLIQSPSFTSVSIHENGRDGAGI